MSPGSCSTRACSTVRIHLVPLVLGEGTPLFAGVQAELTPAAEPVGWSVAHLRYRISKP